jgi:uncharacterized phage infection (PIP) family protein YhgE
MSLLSGLRRLIRSHEPTIIDYEAYDAAQASATGTDGPHVVGRVASGKGQTYFPQAPANTYKIQQSYDSLVETVRELREALDGQSRRQDELLDKLATLPAAVEALPQASKMQSDMLKMINDRLSMHANQQRKVTEIATAASTGKKDPSEALQAIREQFEMGNEIDRQLVDSFNRFSMMIDRLHQVNNQAVEALQQVRDAYAGTSMQMQEWVEKSRHRNGWLIGGAFFMSAVAIAAVIVLMTLLFQHVPQMSQ